jgi:3-methyladenine DNA glycosylase AlkC
MSGVHSEMIRKGARRMVDVPPQVLADLSAGLFETANLMEWLATDMSQLAQVIAAGPVPTALRTSLSEAAEGMRGRGVTDRLRLAGAAIARGLPEMSGSTFKQLSSHRSDIVRQWVCYAVNDPSAFRSLEDRLGQTLPFASDANMSVREAAWMAFRPHLAQSLQSGLELLSSLSRSEDPNIRRFAVEVSRPRSVWGAHILQLKRDPNPAGPLLENTRSDPSKYVRLAVGNWLNDASKTRSDWVHDTCARWQKAMNPHTDFIVRRAMRSMARASSINGRLI